MCRQCEPDGRIRIIGMPRDDGEFATVIRDVEGDCDLLARGPDAMGDALRQRFPRVVVRAQVGLAHWPGTPLVWYAYRDGRVVAEPVRSTQAPDADESQAPSR